MSFTKTIATTLTVAAGLVAIAACHPQPGGSNTTSTHRSAPNSGGIVVGTEYSRDSDHPNTGTHQADCRDNNGNTWRVTITAEQADQLAEGDPCPAGPHEPMPWDKYPELWSEMNKPLPYSGGDANGPCGEWSAATKKDADEMKTAWQKCISQHGHR